VVCFILLCVAGWPDSRIGVFVNLAVAAVLLFSRRLAGSHKNTLAANVISFRGFPMGAISAPGNSLHELVLTLALLCTNILVPHLTYRLDPAQHPRGAGGDVEL
jgi:hypothetical protein